MRSYTMVGASFHALLILQASQHALFFQRRFVDSSCWGLNNGRALNASPKIPNLAIGRALGCALDLMRNYLRRFIYPETYVLLSPIALQPPL